MATLNITHNGISADYPFPVDTHLKDADIRRVAMEVIQSGEIPSLRGTRVSRNTFSDYVVDRFREGNRGDFIYLRPKVPFG